MVEVISSRPSPLNTRLSLACRPEGLTYAERNPHLNPLLLFHIMRRRGADITVPEVLTCCFDTKIRSNQRSALFAEGVNRFLLADAFAVEPFVQLAPRAIDTDTSG